MISDSLHTVDSLAVDWISRNIYWVDVTMVSVAYWLRILQLIISTLLTLVGNKYHHQQSVA